MNDTLQVIEHGSRITFKGFSEFTEDKVFVAECDVFGLLSLREEESDDGTTQA